MYQPRRYDPLHPLYEPDDTYVHVDPPLLVDIRTAIDSAIDSEDDWQQLDSETVDAIRDRAAEAAHQEANRVLHQELADALAEKAALAGPQQWECRRQSFPNEFGPPIVRYLIDDESGCRVGYGPTREYAVGQALQEAASRRCKVQIVDQSREDAA